MKLEEMKLSSVASRLSVLLAAHAPKYRFDVHRSLSVDALSSPNGLVYTQDVYVSVRFLIDHAN